jgi:hypothetical protein
MYGVTKGTQFSSQNRKLAQTSVRFTKVHDNGTTLIRGKTARHDNLVNTNLFVKYYRPEEENEKEKLAENVEKEIQLTISDFRPCELLVLQGA